VVLHPSHRPTRCEAVHLTRDHHRRRRAHAVVACHRPPRRVARAGGDGGVGGTRPQCCPAVCHCVSEVAVGRGRRPVAKAQRAVGRQEHYSTLCCRRSLGGRQDPGRSQERPASCLRSLLVPRTLQLPSIHLCCVHASAGPAGSACFCLGVVFVSLSLVGAGRTVGLISCTASCTSAVLQQRLTCSAYTTMFLAFSCYLLSFLSLSLSDSPEGDASPWFTSPCRLAQCHACNASTATLSFGQSTTGGNTQLPVTRSRWNEMRKDTLE